MNVTKTVNKNGLYRDAFFEVFKSMQLSSAYTLYYDVDMSKEELQEFHKKLTIHNDEDLEHRLDKASIREEIKNKYQFDCTENATKFPFRVKMKMTGKHVKDTTLNTLTAAATDAIELFLTLAIYTMKTDYQFDKEKIYFWFMKLVAFCKLYADGLTDEHVLQYFMQECELEIYEE